MKTYDLKIDPVLKRLVFPLSPEEKRIVEDEICESGARHNIRVWNNFILVDYEYYDYCQMLQLEYETVSICLRNNEEAVAWVCENQSYRQNLPDEMRKYLIGKRCATEIALGAHEFATRRKRKSRRAEVIAQVSKYDSTISQTRERLASEYGIGINTIRKYEFYANAIDQLREVVPDFMDEHLAGKIKISMARVEAMAQLSVRQIFSECEQIKVDLQSQRVARWKKRLQKEIEENAETERAVSIKDMPAYDPDAEISSLSLTIPSWISSIERVRNVTNMVETSRSARIRLEKGLKNLITAADVMLQRIGEVSDGRLF